MHIFYLLFVVFLAIIARSEQKFVIPDITIRALKKGLSVSMPDSSGVQQFAFHANVNQDIRGKEDGTISREVGYAQNGIWIIRDPDIQLKVGDVINYWVFVQHSRLGFDKQDQKFTVTELVDGSSSEPSVGPCTDSSTRINGGERVCGNTKIFEDTFDNLDESKWVKEQYVPWGPDYEFNTYEKRNQNCFVSDGNLYLKATLREDHTIKTIDLTSGCSGEGKNCTFSAVGTLNPPIVGAKIKSKFSFQYGRIEIRAQLPLGDWLYPQLYLEAKENFYGEGYKSGRMWIGYARGNRDLKKGETGEQIGNTVLYSGPVLDVDEPQRSYKARATKSTMPWGNDYHTYTLLWRPDGITISVDNDYSKSVQPPYAMPDGPHQDIWLAAGAPFDKEFVITLGIGAGGASDFPEGCTSNGIKKPWKRTNSKATLFFYNAKDKWISSWNGDKSSVKIDYIRVWSL